VRHSSGQHQEAEVRRSTRSDPRRFVGGGGFSRRLDEKLLRSASLPIVSDSQERADRRLAAILTADVVGYSRLMGEDEEGTHAALKAIRHELTDPRIDEDRGRIVKTTGDGLLVEFASVVDAVRCAVAMQREMAQRNEGVPANRRIEFRIGINLGDIIIDEDDIFGDGVNVAARLEPLAEPGGICISQAVRDQVRDKLDLAFEDMGERRVKNITRPVRVYRIPVASNAVMQVSESTRPSKIRVFDSLFMSLSRLDFRPLAIIICVTVTASVLPSNHRDEISPRMVAVTEALVASPAESNSAVVNKTARSTAIGEPIFFEKGKVVVSDAARLTIDRQAAFLRENPRVTVTIEGYSSEDEGAREGPSILAQLRANQIRNALKERGVADSRMQTISYGTTKPAVVGDSEATQALNRRAVIVLN
jgi:class 3 adenylate cyclase/outer membrane protein OmpA-like peptidoglycan-associated protein